MGCKMRDSLKEQRTPEMLDIRSWEVKTDRKPSSEKLKRLGKTSSTRMWLFPPNGNTPSWREDAAPKTQS